ncbi:DNA cytosine methyltransferase [Campylobacter hyointestinalis]|uniref:Cytosine-specific methyltransferase n=1 Tax=Campylobacter hyointestinalis subsp. hyointestinalis TaxID=91352 RepID=A0A9W5EYQ5_CAMHY|nr:DNA cytosine methyltransferase [Campylobacter hyointestinalis]CUU74328.1 cytosine-specific methyltransferase NlaX [Campylobacter hyointestinalis subsp. hyointestinalis]CUU82120.1 cytosine-specific methyltransferase NlaX [Campylobacter hyointestinalis subsp. hyointestinalis]
MTKFIDLFAGIGGIRLGFQNAFSDAKCVFSSEIDKFAIQTYIANHKEIPHGDITQIDASLIPDFDVLLAGFPCQPFSQAGLGLGFSDTRGSMFFEIERILKAKKPRAFLLENVKRLKTHDKGRTFKTILEHLKSLGYYTHYEVLSAKDFGIPQNRERIIIVGFDSDVPFKFPIPQQIQTKVGDILESSFDEKYIISDKLWAGHQKRKIQNKIAKKGFGYSLFDENSPYTNTISARYYKDGSEILINVKGKNPRKLTPREAARLQGFDDSFQIVVSDPQAYKQFGNSVCVPVITAVAKQMRLALQSRIWQNLSA